MATKRSMCSDIQSMCNVPAFQFQFVYYTKPLSCCFRLIFRLIQMYLVYFPAVLRMLSTKNLSLCTALHEWGCWRVEEVGRKKNTSHVSDMAMKTYKRKSNFHVNHSIHHTHTHTHAYNIRNEKTKGKNMKIMECWKPNETNWKNRWRRRRKMIQEENGQNKNKKNKHNKDRGSIECATIFIHCV